jgi:hypothetical protein
LYDGFTTQTLLAPSIVLYCSTNFISFKWILYVFTWSYVDILYLKIPYSANTLPYSDNY